MVARKTRYKIPDLKPDSGELETYFEAAQRWQGPELSKSRVGSALQLSGLAKQQVEDIFEAGLRMWKDIGTNDKRIADLDYRCEDVCELRTEIEAALRDRFAEVFEKRCRSLAEEEFVNERAPGMIVYRTWHIWSRKERRTVVRRRGQTGVAGNQQSAGSVYGETSRAGAATDAPIDSTLGDAAAVGRAAQHPPIVEIYSSNNQDELLRLNVKHLLDDPNDEATFTPSFAKLESQLREHPLIAGWPDKLLFIHIYGKDQNAFVFNQETLDTAFEEWMWKESKLGAFRLYIVECDGVGRPPRIVLK